MKIPATGAGIRNKQDGGAAGVCPPNRASHADQACMTQGRHL